MRLPGLGTWWLHPFAALVIVALTGDVSASSTARHPIVKWGQKSDKLYLTVLMKDFDTPTIKLEERRVRVNATSQALSHTVDLKLLRSINVTASTYEVNTWSVQFQLKKERREPCWKRLLKASGSPPGWLKKDTDRLYVSDCQRAKEDWREAYFTNKLKEERGSKAAAPTGDAMAAPPDREEVLEAWERTIKRFRDKAVPRSSVASQKSSGKASKRKAKTATGEL
mmetsp:Transcript_17786/g.41256  ORF Transcript_17786/g.41256 Transcript_17786/m.41256 type:complete len:225 (-) Transcript_17786:27-701(-)